VTRAGRTEAPAATTSTTGARFEVGAEGAGQRLDALVSQALGLSRAAARRLVAAGRVRLDGRAPRKGASVGAGAVVTVAGPLSREVEPVPDHHATPEVGEGAISVVYEDADLLAVNKPAGMPSHPLRAGERGTAANFLVGRDPACAGASLDPREGGLGHRLDTATSGVLIAGRSRPAWLALRASLGGPECEKRYLAEVWGAPPSEGRIDAAIGRRGRRGKTVRLDAGRNPQPAETTWKVLERRPATTLVEARLHAGRPHQVRAHLAGAGFPIVGDDRYGPPVAGPPETEPHGGTDAGQPASATPTSGPGRAPRLHLHAAAITFRHPTTKALVTVTAPAPPWASVGVRPFAV